MNYPTILIDDREGRGGLAEALRRRGASGCEVTRLAIGDAWIGDIYVVERKAVRDFVASLLEGRLARQLDGLIKSPRKALLILEGDLRPEDTGGLSAWSLRRAMLAVTLDWGIPLLRSRDVEDTAAWLLALAGWGDGPDPVSLDFRPRQGKTTAGAPAHAPRKSVNRQPQAVPLAALRGVPGLGRVRAEGLLAHFGSMQALIEADVEALAAVNGIGPILAREIRRKLGT